MAVTSTQNNLRDGRRSRLAATTPTATKREEIRLVCSIITEKRGCDEGSVYKKKCVQCGGGWGRKKAEENYFCRLCPLSDGAWPFRHDSYGVKVEETKLKKVNTDEYDGDGEEATLVIWMLESEKFQLMALRRVLFLLLLLICWRFFVLWLVNLLRPCSLTPLELHKHRHNPFYMVLPEKRDRSAKRMRGEITAVYIYGDVGDDNEFTEWKCWKWRSTFLDARIECWRASNAREISRHTLVLMPWSIQKSWGQGLMLDQAIIDMKFPLLCLLFVSLSEAAHET